MRVITKAPGRITKATIDATWRQRSAGTRLIVRDKECRGLALIVNPTTMTWTYAYRPRGRDAVTGRRWPNQTITLGNPETHSPEDARAEGNRIKGQAAAGADPATDRKAKAEAMRRERSATMGRLAEKYGAVLATRPKLRGTGNASPAYVAEELAQIDLALAELDAEGTVAAAFGVSELRKLLDRLSTMPSAARKRFGAVSRFLDWCQDAGHIQTNPCTLIARARRPKAVQSRAHYLTLVEVARLWKAADGLTEPVRRDFARFLFAVPCRRCEVAALEWSHIDMAAAEWRQAGRMTKNREPHRLYLHPLALSVLRVRHQAFAEAQAEGDPVELARIMAAGQPRKGLVFPGPRSRTAITAFSGIKAAVVDATATPDDATAAAIDPLTGWTWHDMRRSFATALGEAGIPEAIADAVLNHRQAATRGGVLGVYQRGSRWPEQMRAMELWGKLLAEAITGAPTPANVVPMMARAG